MSLSLDQLLKYIKPNHRQDFINLLQEIEKATSGSESMKNLPEEKIQYFVSKYKEYTKDNFTEDFYETSLKFDYSNYIRRKRFESDIKKVSELLEF